MNTKFIVIYEDSDACGKKEKAFVFETKEYRGEPALKELHDAIVKKGFTLMQIKAILVET